MNFQAFAARVRKAGLDPAQPKRGHWQARGGLHLVNVYPFGRKGPTLYVAGAAKGVALPIGTTVAELADKAVEAAELPPDPGVRVKRSKSSRRRRKVRMMRADPHCHWCRAALTLDPEHVDDDTRLGTLDHKIPLGAGGLDHHNNYVLACRECNESRADQPGPPEET